MQLLYSSTQIFSGLSNQEVIYTGDQDLTFVLRFNTTYLTHANSRFYIDFPSTVQLNGASPILSVS